MPPEIDAIAFVLDRTGDPTDNVVSLDNDRFVVRPFNQLEGGRQARRARTDDDRNLLSRAGNGALNELS